MTGEVQRMGLPRLIWRALLQTSEVATAIHYHAPWLRAEPVPVRAAPASSWPEAGAGGACPAC